MTQARIWLSGFLLLGVLLGLPGSLLVAWQYHIEGAPQTIGLHFLALNGGYVAAMLSMRHGPKRRWVRGFVLAGYGIAALGLGAAGAAGPPVELGWRLGALATMGAGAGCLGTSLLFASEPYFRFARARAVNEAATLFGCGCLFATVLVGTTYYLGSVEWDLFGLAAAPVILMIWLGRKAQGVAGSRTERRPSEPVDNRSIAALLFSALLFLQGGNEWAIAGWLPLFLIHRFGTNPAIAIGVLAMYFFALMMGRWMIQPLMRRFNHEWLLALSVLTAACGSGVLCLTRSLSEATAATAVLGLGYAPIYPLIVDQLDHRFRFEPKFYSGTIGFAITGAMSIPWLLGFIAAAFGLRYVMLAPAFGSLAVLVLSLLLTLEAHLMQDEHADPDKFRQYRDAS